MPPVLTVRAFAEMLELPMYAQLRILEEQKNPTKAPASFRVPYYGPALVAIRKFYLSGRQAQVLHDAVAKLQGSSMPQSRIRNNVRVIRAFQKSKQARRQLSIKPGTRLRHGFSGVELKYTPDLAAAEGQTEKLILYNLRQAPLTARIAATTLELVGWICVQSGTPVDLADLEIIDLAVRGGRVYRIRRIRKQTVRRAQQNARAIVQIWAGIP